jgi:hypothetical protein
MRVFDAAIRSLVANGASYVVQLENMARGLGFGRGSSPGSGIAQTLRLVAASPAASLSWVNGKLGRRQSENKPASARVDRRHAHHVCEECADLLSLRGEHDRAYSGDHGATLTAARAVVAVAL